MDEMEKMEQAQEAAPEETTVGETKEVYIPRPAWQVWGARIALALFVAVLIMYYVNLLKG